MSRKATTLRLDPLVHDFIARQAARAGVSFNDFVAGAALTRAALSLAAGEPFHMDDLLGLADRATEAISRLGT